MSPSTSGTAAEMPKYRCHKEVWAFKIKSITLDSEEAAKEGRESTGGAVITPDDHGFMPFIVGHAYVHKHKPEAGGYYVRYKDGYESFSPAKAFEDGYSPICKPLKVGDQVRFSTASLNSTDKIHVVESSEYIEGRKFYRLAEITGLFIDESLTKI